MSDDDDPYLMRGKQPYELEIIIAKFDGSGAGDSNVIKAAAARGELTRQQREHERELVDKQLLAANRQLAIATGAAHATKSASKAAWAAVVAAIFSAVAAIIQVLVAIMISR